MNTFVRVLNGPDAGRTIALRHGEVAQFGRTRWADYAFPSDAELGDVHFELRCEPSGQVVLRNLATRDTLLDGVAISEATLKPGQRISAGTTLFAVLFDSSESGLGTATLRSNAGDATNGPAYLTGEPDGQTASEICSRFELEADEPPNDELSAAEFAASLIASGRLRDALRFQAYRLEKRHAVWWAWRCLSSQPDLVSAPGTADALKATHNWLLDPSEATARTASDIAEKLNFGPAAAWAATAAFWSSDNIAPPAAEAVGPSEHLTGAAVSAAVLLGSIDATPKATATRQQLFLDIADRILSGEDVPPAPR